jgi:hypothetical protein
MIPMCGNTVNSIDTSRVYFHVTACLVIILLNLPVQLHRFFSGALFPQKTYWEDLSFGTGLLAE